MPNIFKLGLTKISSSFFGSRNDRILKNYQQLTKHIEFRDKISRAGLRTSGTNFENCKNFPTKNC